MVSNTKEKCAVSALRAIEEFGFCSQLMASGCRSGVAITRVYAILEPLFNKELIVASVNELIRDERVVLKAHCKVRGKWARNVSLNSVPDESMMIFNRFTLTLGSEDLSVEYSQSVLYIHDEKMPGIAIDALKHPLHRYDMSPLAFNRVGRT